MAKAVINIRPGRLVIVDYGCGEGELLRYLPLDRVKKYQGWEINSESVKAARRQWRTFKSVHFETIKPSKLPSLGAAHSIDAIILIGVVQYLPDRDLTHVLKEARRVLKPDGQLLISCTTDHWFYLLVNVYRLFLPHREVNRTQLTHRITQHDLNVTASYERGLLLTPLFANVVVFFFDALDKIFFRTKGELGPVGRTVRRWWAPVIKWEFSWPIDYGYTLFLVAKKK